MTGTEIIRMLLCITGFDRNVQVSTYRGVEGVIGYNFYGENKDGETLSDYNCEGLAYNVWEILQQFKEGQSHANIDWIDAPQYIFKTDKSVNNLRKEWDKNEAETIEKSKKNEPVIKWLEENNPCSEECTDNDHLDKTAVHYGCSKKYYHNCPKLKESDEKFSKFKENLSNE